MPLTVRCSSSLLPLKRTVPGVGKRHSEFAVFEPGDLTGKTSPQAAGERPRVPLLRTSHHLLALPGLKRAGIFFWLLSQS